MTEEIKALTPIETIIKASDEYFKNYDEDHKFEDLDDCDGSEPYAYKYNFSSSGIFKIQNKYGTILDELEIHKYSPEYDEDIDKYSVELSFKTPNKRYRHSSICLYETHLDKEQLPEALKKIFTDFQKIKKCNNCLDLILKPVDGSDICVECCVRELLGNKKINCAICMEDTSFYVTLPCEHTFHYDCFSNIEHKYQSDIGKCCQECPLCRIKIISEGSGPDLILKKLESRIEQPVKN